jgi:hypothetical protein
MNMFMIHGASWPPRIGSLAVVSGTLLCAAAASPALSADYPEYDRYRPRYEYYAPRYDDRECYRCDCCGARRYGPTAELPIADRYPAPYEEPRRFPERRWVQRDYLERRYPGGAVPYSYPDRYSYSTYYPRPPRGAEDPYRDPYRAAIPPGPPVRYGSEYPPAPVTYEYDAPRPRFVEPPRPYELHPAYEYEQPRPPRSAYDYETAPRPSAMVPSGYYYGPGRPE